MSYTIEPMPLISFLDENKMRLPRFQRKATWDKKQNFELCISVFQDYPVGVVIVNKEQKVSWLLDGRQRRNALKIMRDNPVELYEWGRSYIGFAKTADELEVKKAYWDKVDKYLQTEIKEKDGKEKSDNEEDIVEYEEEDITEYDSISEDSGEEKSFDSEKQRKGLQTLLDIILMVHQNKPSGSKWEQTFNFTNFFTRLIYAPIKNNCKVQPVLLRRFLIQLLKEFEANNEGELTAEAFVEYYVQMYDITESNQKKFEKEVFKRWDNIKNSIDVIDRSEKIFAEARIGVIWLTNATPLDAQNIFSRINKGGTQLKAEELLSAKPYWNVEVQISDREVIDKVTAMYTKLDVPRPDSIVRWDLAATLISRINDQNLIFDSYNESKKNIDISLDEITLGFKLISSIYEKGMSGKNVIDLEKNQKINWEKDISKLVEDINIVCKILLSTDFFQYLQSWKKPITKLLGNAIALEFITILWLDWNEKGCPMVSSSELKSLQRDAKILFDRLVFEYATKVWRGSGDSKMSNDIKNWKSRIVPVNKSDWRNFIEGACNGNYNGQDTTVKLLRPVLYYYYVLTNCLPLNKINTLFDVDHIIPQEKFKGNSMIELSMKDSLINLALLPKKDNISKKNKSLNEVVDSWLKDSITIYTGIEKENFEKFSNLANISELKQEREELFLVAFDTNRDAKLSN